MSVLTGPFLLIRAPPLSHILHPDVRCLYPMETRNTRASSEDLEMQVFRHQLTIPNTQTEGGPNSVVLTRILDDTDRCTT